MFGQLPEFPQQLALVRAGREFHRARLRSRLLKILRHKQHLAPAAVRVEHGDADHLGRQWPQIELAHYFVLALLARLRLGQIQRVAEKILLLGGVKLRQRQRGGFDVKH